MITCQATSSGTISTVLHDFFQEIENDAPNSPNSPGSNRNNENRSRKEGTIRELVSRFCQAIALLKLELAWQTALELDKRCYWLALSNRAMEMLNIDMAMRVYRQLGDAGMVS